MGAGASDSEEPDSVEEAFESAEGWEAEGCLTEEVSTEAVTGLLSESDPQAHKQAAMQYVISKMRIRADKFGIRIEIVISCCYCSMPVP